MRHAAMSWSRGRRHMGFGGGSGFKGMEGFFKQEKLKEKVNRALDAKAKAEQYLARRDLGEPIEGGHDGMPPPPWEAPPPPMGVAAMVRTRRTFVVVAYRQRCIQQQVPPPTCSKHALSFATSYHPTARPRRGSPRR